MTDTRFTPGPWYWNEDRFHGGWSGLYGADDEPVIVPQSANDGDDGAAWFATVDDAGECGLKAEDMSLIAAARDLYEVLDAIKSEVSLELWKAVDGEKALAKARGE